MFFPNLQVASVKASTDFWTALGYSFNEQFSSETVVCLVLEEDAVAVMLHEPASFTGFLPGTTASDPATSTEVLLAFSLDSREAVDTLVDGVLANGGTVARPTEDLGFMYTRSFRDIDGHIWEPFFMDMAAAAAMAQEGAHEA